MIAALRVGRLSGWQSGVLLALGGAFGGLALGAATARSTAQGATALVAAVLLVAAIARPANVAVIAVLGAFAVQRLGSSSAAPGSPGGISYSDALLALAAFLALPAMVGRPEFGRIRAALLGVGVYLSALLPTVIDHASTRNYLEWLHRLVLVGGGLLVGAWIAREGLVRVTLRWLLFAACVIAVLAIENSARNGFAAAHPLHLQKNFVGAVLSSVLVLAVAGGRRYLGVGYRLQVLVVVLIAGGLLAAQSRGGALAAVAGLLTAFLFGQRGRSRRLRAVGLLVAAALGVFAYVSIHAQLNQSKQAAELGSLGVRANVEKETRRIWHTSPVVGVGLKYFNTGEFGPLAQPANNDVDNELAESGVIGLVGFVILQCSVTAIALRRRRDNPLVAPALGLVLGLLLHGMVDIYWTAGTVSLPFMILGMALALPSERHGGESGRTTDRRPRHAIGAQRSGEALMSSSRETS